MGKWNIGNDMLCPVLVYAKTLVFFTKYTMLTEGAEIALETTWGTCRAMKELPAKACFLWLLAQTIPGCLFRCTKNWTILKHRCFYFSIFGQNCLLQEKSMVVCFSLLHCFWAAGVCVQERPVQNFFICILFHVFPTIDYIFHFYVYIHLWLGREGGECLSCRSA